MRKLKLQNFFSAIVIFILTYLLFIHPFNTINLWINNIEINLIISLSYTGFIFFIIIIYFKTKFDFFILRLFVYEGIGIGFIALMISTLINIVGSLFRLEGLTMAKYFLIFFLPTVLISYILSLIIKTRSIIVHSNKIKRNYNIVFISDIHLGSNSINHLKKLFAKIIKLNPDLILIGGDLIDNSSFNISELKILKNVVTPIYFVTGNHEYYIKNSLNKIQQLRNFNIKVLDNRSVYFDDLNIIGISDNQNLDSQKKSYNEMMSKNSFNLALVHKPSLWASIKKNCDLMLSGHTHNGQIFPFNYIVKIKFKHNYGLFKYLNSNLYVSSGAATWGPKFRLGSYNEIVNIQLKSI